MSNDAYFYNTSIQHADFFNIGKSPTRSEYAGVATGVYRLPIPWFFCFDVTDLSYLNFEFDTTLGMSSVNLTVPYTTSKKAIENLYSSQDLMRKICGDSEIGDSYWKWAVERFVNLRFDYVTFAYVDIFLGAEWNDDRFRLCFERTDAALEAIREFAGYSVEHVPYSADVFFKNPPLSDAHRSNNSAALNFGFD